MLSAKVVRPVRNQKGMTLIELLAVVIILGILATVAGVAVVNASQKAKESADTATISVIKDAAQRYLFENDGDVKATNGVDITVEQLIGGLYLRDIPIDSAGNIFTGVNVKVDDTAGTITWTFNATTSDGTTPASVFAPNAK